MPDTAITLPFADGEFRFWMPLPAVIELERRAGRSIFTVYDDLGTSTATRGDVCETIRLGLIGGASGWVDGDDIEVSPMRAQRLVDMHVAARPLSDGSMLAWCILHAAVSGIDLQRRSTGRAPSKAQPLRKGQVVSNCAGMGLDWERLSLSAYLEGLESHNAAHSGEPGRPAPGSKVDHERLRRFMEAHRDRTPPNTPETA